jgi:recombination protein RecA
MSKQKTPAEIAKIMAAINKGFKGAATILGEGAKSDVKEVIPSGLEVLDKYVIGCGGWPVGRISEVFSEEGGGKTSLLLAALAGAQRAGGIAVMVETEVALDSQRAKVFGVDLSKVILLQPGHLDEATRQIELTLESIPPDVGPVFIGWDSLAATMSKEEAEDGLPDKDSFDKRAKGISQAMRVLSPLVARARCHLMLINQVRANIGVLFGDKHVTPGGKAVKFHASVRVQLFGGRSIKDPGGQHLGKDVTVVAVKNKLTRPYRKARARLMYDTGWDTDWSTLDHAKTLKVIDARARDVAAARKSLDAVEWYKSSSAPVVTPDNADVDSPEDDGYDPDGL